MCDDTRILMGKEKIFFMGFSTIFAVMSRAYPLGINSGSTEGSRKLKKSQILLSSMTTVKNENFRHGGVGILGISLEMKEKPPPSLFPSRTFSFNMQSEVFGALSV